MDNIVKFTPVLPESECPCCGLRDELLSAIMTSGLPIDEILMVLDDVASEAVQIIGGNDNDDAA
jgi:hypothetical protein